MESSQEKCRALGSSQTFHLGTNNLLQSDVGQVTFPLLFPVGKRRSAASTSLRAHTLSTSSLTGSLGLQLVFSFLSLILTASH